MSITTRLPDDPVESQRLLDDLLRDNDALRQQAEDARRRIDELERILDQTAADYERLQEEHAELAETLARPRRYVFGPRRERRADAPDQGHLFDLPEFAPELLTPTLPGDVAPPRPRPARPSRRARFDHLPHIRI